MLVPKRGEQERLGKDIFKDTPHVKTISTGIVACVTALCFHFLPGENPSGSSCSTIEPENPDLASTGFMDATKLCQLIKSNDYNLSYFDERIHRWNSLLGSKEKKSQKMNIAHSDIPTIPRMNVLSSLDKNAPNFVANFAYLDNEIKRYLSENDSKIFTELLSLIWNLNDAEGLRALKMLERVLQNESPDKEEIIGHVRYVASNMERMMNRIQNPDSLMMSKEEHQSINEVAKKTSERFNITRTKDSNDIFNKPSPPVSGMSSVEGRITQMTTVLDRRFSSSIIDLLNIKAKQGDPFILDVFYSTPRELSDFLIDLEKANIPHVERYLRLTYNAVTTDHGLTIASPWVRDSNTFAYTKSGHPVVFRPKYAGYIGKQFHEGPDIMALRANLDIHQSSLTFRGGNLRQTNDTLFVGWDEIVFNIPRLKPFLIMNSKKIYNSTRKDSESKYSYDKVATPSPVTDIEIQNVVSEFEREFGKKVVIIGRDIQSKQTEADVLQGQHIYHLDIFFTPLGGKRVALADYDSEWMRSIRKDLIARGYEVFPMPIRVAGKFGQYALTYNNVILENYTKEGKKIKQVYLPQYHSSAQESKAIAEFDAQAVTAWKKTGYSVIPIRVDVENLQANGSLNCRVNEIRELTSAL